jgi:hypothetical protein
VDGGARLVLHSPPGAVRKYLCARDVRCTPPPHVATPRAKCERLPCDI